jgi:hypothetical protein
MICRDCPLKYVGHTGHTFRTRYNEHIREIQTNGKTSKYAQHILNTTHNYDTMQKLMNTLHVEQKRQMFDTLQNYYIHAITKQGLQMNEIYKFLRKTKQNIKKSNLFQNSLPTPTAPTSSHIPPTPPP